MIYRLDIEHVAIQGCLPHLNNVLKFGEGSNERSYFLSGCLLGDGNLYSTCPNV